MSRIGRIALLSLGLALLTLPARAQRIIAFGDSITRGFGDELGVGYAPRLQSILRAERMPNAIVANFGVDGERTSAGVSRIDSVLATGANLVVLMEGTNDIFAGISVETTRFNLNQIALKAQLQGVSTLHATVVPQIPTSQSDPQNVVTARAAADLRQLAQSHKRGLVDPFAAFLAIPGVFQSHYYQGPDPVGHPSGRGYDLLARQFADWIRGSRMVLTIDAPAAGASVAAPLTISGWALDRLAPSGAGVDAVHVYATPANGGPAIGLGAATLGLSRPDIAAWYGARFSSTGFALSVPALAPGAYTLSVFARSSVNGDFDALAQTPFTVPASNVQLSIDTPAAGARVLAPFSVEGWALDRAASAGSGVDAIEVWALPQPSGNPINLGLPTLGRSRPDVAAAFGAQFGTSGYQLSVASGALAPGSYTLRVFARSAITRIFSGVRDSPIVVEAPPPLLTIDLPGSGSVLALPIRIAGWAIDRRAPSGSGIDAVHVYAFPKAGGGPIGLGAATLGVSRPDVAAVYGARYANAGFTLDVSTGVPPGEYTLAVFARSSLSGGFDVAAEVPFRVVNNRIASEPGDPRRAPRAALRRH